VVLLVLAVVWAAFLTPQVLRARAEKTPADSIGAFRNQLSVLERTAPAGLGRHYHRSSASVRRPARVTATRRSSSREMVRRRRRDVLLALLAAMGTTLLLGMIPVFHALLLVHVVLDLLFVAYCAMLVRARTLVVERDMKVRYLPGPMLVPEPGLLLRSSNG
jgi:hypothetical protein